MDRIKNNGHSATFIVQPYEKTFIITCMLYSIHILFLYVIRYTRYTYTIV